VELKAREQLELIERLETLEEQLERQRRRGAMGLRDVLENLQRAAELSCVAFVDRR